MTFFSGRSVEFTRHILVTVRIAWNPDRGGTKKVPGTVPSGNPPPPKVNRTEPYHAVEKLHKSVDMTTLFFLGWVDTQHPRLPWWWHFGGHERKHLTIGPKISIFEKYSLKTQRHLFHKLYISKIEIFGPIVKCFLSQIVGSHLLNKLFASDYQLFATDSDRTIHHYLLALH